MGSGNDPDPWLSNDPWKAGASKPARAGTPPPSDDEPSGASEWINSKSVPVAKFPPPAAPAAPAPAPAAPAPAAPAPAASAPAAPAPAPATARAPEARFPDPKPTATYQVPAAPASGFPESKKKTWTFHIQLWKEHPADKMGIRAETVEGYGFESVSRVHKIFQGGMVSKWNDMAVANGMPDWQLEVDDVIAGINGRLNFHPEDEELQDAIDLDLLIIRDLP